MAGAHALVLAVAVLHLPAGVALAQGADDDDARTGDSAARDIAEARRHFEQGVALFQEDDMEAALAEFRASYGLNPLPQVLFNIAVSLRRLRRYAEAADSLRQYLAGPADESAERRELAQSLVTELEALLARVSLSVDREDADVFVDGELVGRTPLDGPLRLATGEHVVEVRLDGFQTFRERVAVHGGQDIDLTVELDEVRRPWYRRWWPWTVLGVVVTGTAVGLAVGLTAEPRGTELDVVVRGPSSD